MLGLNARPKLLSQMHNINSTSRGNVWSQSGVIHHCAQLGLSDKVRANKRFKLCYVIWQGSIIYMGWIFGTAQGAWVWSLFEVGMAIMVKFCKRAQIHADRIQYIFFCQRCTQGKKAKLLKGIIQNIITNHLMCYTFLGCSFYRSGQCNIG